MARIKNWTKISDSSRMVKYKFIGKNRNFGNKIYLMKGNNWIVTSTYPEHKFKTHTSRSKTDALEHARNWMKRHLRG